MIVISVFPPEGAFEISLFANPYLAPAEGGATNGFNSLEKIGMIAE